MNRVDKYIRSEILKVLHVYRSNNDLVVKFNINTRKLDNLTDLNRYNNICIDVINCKYSPECIDCKVSRNDPNNTGCVGRDVFGYYNPSIYLIRYYIRRMYDISG